MSKFTKAIGEKLAWERKDKALTQEDLGELCGLQGKYIGFIEQGRHEIGIEMARKICKALKIKMSDLFKGY